MARSNSISVSLTKFNAFQTGHIIGRHFCGLNMQEEITDDKKRAVRSQVVDATNKPKALNRKKYEC